MSLIDPPIAILLLVSIQNLRSWSQLRQMQVLNVADRFSEVTQVILFCKPGELRDIIQPYIDKSLHVCFLESSEKFFR
jgi:hypothetical protein